MAKRRKMAARNGNGNVAAAIMAIVNGGNGVITASGNVQSK